MLMWLIKGESKWESHSTRYKMCGWPVMTRLPTKFSEMRSWLRRFPINMIRILMTKAIGRATGYDSITIGMTSSRERMGST